MAIIARISAVGSSAVDWSTQSGAKAAKLALRILGGEKPDGLVPPGRSMTLSHSTGASCRSGESANRACPPAASCSTRARVYEELYKWHITGVISLCVVEALLILGLLMQRVSRRRAERVRQSQHELRSLTGRLIHAQEEERRRIARELHDDLNQRLALLAIELDLLAQKPPSPMPSSVIACTNSPAGSSNSLRRCMTCPTCSTLRKLFNWDSWRRFAASARN